MINFKIKKVKNRILKSGRNSNNFNIQHQFGLAVKNWEKNRVEEVSPMLIKLAH